MAKEEIYIYLNFNEALESKKRIIENEIGVIKLLKILEKYSNLRKKELEKKEELRKKLKQLVAKINGFMRNLPKVKGEIKIKRREDKGEKIKKKVEKSAKVLEAELKELKEKLKELEKII